MLCSISVQFIQSLSRVRLFATPWIATRQASLSITNSWSLPKPMCIELVMPSSHLILCRPLLLLPLILPSIRIFSNESILHMKWPNDWSFSFNISPSNEHPGLISFIYFFFNFLFFLNFKIFNSYMRSQTWTPLPPPSPQHLSGSSPCTSPKQAAPYVRHGLAIQFLHDSIHVIIPILPNHPTLSLSLWVQKSGIHICVFFPVLHTGSSLPSS